MHHETGRRHTDLPRVPELGGGQQFGGLFDIGILKHDDRGMPAQFHRGAFHMGPRQSGKLFADRG